jgi:DNA-3-methyladenine glycosylase
MPGPPLLTRDFFRRDPLPCAQELVGMELVHGPCRGIILETEAYRETGDPACHLSTRPSAREFARRHEPGTAYVYLNYGVHWLVNVLCRDEATGEAGFVLFRALEAVAGIERMSQRRGTGNPLQLCSGPGKLTAALGIDGSFHGRSLVTGPRFCLRHPSSPAGFQVITDRRIGISAGQELEWRFLARGHPGLSVKPSNGTR